MKLIFKGIASILSLVAGLEAIEKQTFNTLSEELKLIVLERTFFDISVSDTSASLRLKSVCQNWNGIICKIESDIPDIREQWFSMMEQTWKDLFFLNNVDLPLQKELINVKKIKEFYEKKINGMPMQWMNSLAGINYWGSCIENLEKMMIGLEWFIHWEQGLVKEKDDDYLSYQRKSEGAVELLMYYMAMDIVRKNGIYNVINKKDHFIWNKFKEYTEENLATYQISIPLIQTCSPKTNPLLLKVTDVIPSLTS
jgi:hypothetical protein